MLEQHYPLLFEQYALREQSAGAGKTRGGFGVDYRIRIRRGEGLMSFLMDHGRVGPPGLFGGRDGATRGKALMLSIIYVLGMAITYAAAAVNAARDAGGLLMGRGRTFNVVRVAEHTLNQIASATA